MLPVPRPSFPVLVLSTLGSAALASAALAQNAATPLAPVVSVGTKTERATDEVIGTVEVRDTEQIEQRVPAKLDDLLGDMPGVDFDGGPRRQSTVPNVRGLGNQRVVTTVDGARQNFDAGHKGRVFIDPDLLKRVEVLKGPGSTLFGTGAIGGVVALTTKDASDYLDPGSVTAVRLKYGHSTVAGEPMGSLTLAARPVDQVEFLASVTGRDTGNQDIGGGRELPYSASDSVSRLFKGTLKPGDGHRFTLAVNDMRDNGFTPINLDTNPIVLTELSERRFGITTTTLNYAHEGEKNWWFDPKLTLYRTRIEVRERRLSDRRIDISELDTVGFDAYNTFRPVFGPAWLGHAITIGAEGFQDEQQGFRNGANRPAYPFAQARVGGAYAQHELTFFDRFVLTPGLRWDSYELASAAVVAKREEDKLSAKLGGLFKATDWLNLTLGWAQGFRAPSLTELYATGLHFPGNNFVPNPDLRPERTETWEGGARLKFGGLLEQRDALRLTATYFVTEATDFIEQVVGAVTTTSRNATEAEIDGVELGASYDARLWFASLGAARIRGDNTQTNQPLASIPADKITYTLGGKVPGWDLSFGYRGQAVDEQTRVPAGTLVTSGYVLHGVFATWAADRVLPGLRFDFAVDNLTDVAYRRHLSAVYDEGRDIRASVSWTKQF